MRKLLILLLVMLLALSARTQCSTYQIYESFTSTLTTQGGTWGANSMIAVTTPVRTGTHAIGFNGSGDWIRTPQIASPGVLTFWYRRSSNSTAWTLNIQTSPDATTWTTRGSITTITTTYAQYSLNLGALSLTNVYIRMVDARASGAHERYIDDLGLTSATTNTNILLPILGACSQTLNSSLTYKVTDDGGPAGPTSVGYGNSVSRIITLTPSDNTLKLNLSFAQMDLESTYDFLYVYDGPTTASTLVGTFDGTTIPSDITSTDANGQLTLRWTTDVSNVGAWGGFLINVTSVPPPVALPVELTQFEGTGYAHWNLIEWSTASEHISDYFDLQLSIDGIAWKSIATKTAAGNSTQEIKYSFIDYNYNELSYYKLVQYDFDGAFKEYGPISVVKLSTNKKIVMYINYLGQTIDPVEYKGIFFEIYEDGSSCKKIK